MQTRMIDLRWWNDRYRRVQALGAEDRKRLHKKNTRLIEEIMKEVSVYLDRCGVPRCKPNPWKQIESKQAGQDREAIERMTKIINNMKRNKDD